MSPGSALSTPWPFGCAIDRRGVCGSTFGVGENPGNLDRSIKWAA